MDKAQKILRCSLKYCQTENFLSSQFCSRCGSPLIKRYLWVLGTTFGREKSQQFVVERYLVISEKLVLDTQPGMPPYFPEEIPPWLKPYLKLSPYRLHVPKVYGQIPAQALTPSHSFQEQHFTESDIWLLEYENFSSAVQQRLATGEFLPPLDAVWSSASGTRQLNWLLQMSQLWQPLQVQGVAKTLITPECLHVNGAVVQLQELSADEESVTLKDLGELWSTWVKAADERIRPFLADICQRLQHQELGSSEELTRLLEESLGKVARSQSRSYQIATTTDSGPTRSHNEDAYYQQNNTQDSTPTHQALAIVCDGVGGHQGGEVASHLAIDQLRQEVQKLSELSSDSRLLTEQIEEAVSTVNDLICEENDADHRKAQARMGTTLVMALAHDHEMYVTHVGDSRVYWITAYGCYQLTLDDDLASRQTRLGHLLYREALQQPAAGSLIQALGMSPSQLLHPTTQRLVIDEDCVFLLCSDGLSDNDLVEQYWEQEILPVLEAGKDPDRVAQQLIALANNLNGHDNVTVSLLKCSVVQDQDPTSLAADFTASPSTEPSERKGSNVDKKEANSSREVALLLLILGVVIGGVGIAYWFFPAVQDPLDNVQEQLSPEPTRDPSELPSSE